jgi:hypothetical protein
MNPSGQINSSQSSQVSQANGGIRDPNGVIVPGAVAINANGNPVNAFGMALNWDGSIIGPSMSDYMFWGAIGVVGLGAAYLLFFKK